MCLLADDSAAGALASHAFTLLRAPLPTAILLPLGIFLTLAPLAERVISRNMSRADKFTLAAALFGAAAFMGLVLPSLFVFYQRAMEDLMQGGVVDWERMQDDFRLVWPAWRCRIGHLFMLLFFGAGAFLQTVGLKAEVGAGLLPGGLLGWKQN